MAAADSAGVLYTGAGGLDARKWLKLHNFYLNDAGPYLAFTLDPSKWDYLAAVDNSGTVFSGPGGFATPGGAWQLSQAGNSNLVFSYLGAAKVELATDGDIGSARFAGSGKWVVSTLAGAWNALTASLTPKPPPAQGGQSTTPPSLPAR